MRKFFKRIAAWFVTLYANYVYRTAVKKANEMHKRKKRMYYVASAPFEPNRLAVYDKYRFKAEKEVFGFHARLLTLQSLKNGSWYHTQDRAGNQGMTEKEIEVRRLAFVRERLKAARLI